MSKIWKRIICVLSVLILSTAAFGCAGNTQSEGVGLKYYDELDSSKEFNRNLFYRNDLETDVAADPSAIYVSEGEQEGYYYMYATSGTISSEGFLAYRSRDLSTWEPTGVAYFPVSGSGIMTNLWAPEVIYYKTPAEIAEGKPGKYYMFYSGSWSALGRYAIGLAISDEPQGPFVQWTGKTADNRNVSLGDAFLDSRLFDASLTDSYGKIHSAPLIDVSPFVDDDGSIYLYFSRDRQGGFAPSSCIWGMAMKDIFSPDYSTITPITEYRKVTPGGATMDGEIENTNEAPFMHKHNGTYYMTFSTSAYYNILYSVAQATGDSPLGPFTKVAYNKGGRFLTMAGNGDEAQYDFMAGTGHHSFVERDGELFIVYHAFANRKTYPSAIKNARAIASDRITFIDNGDDVIMHANGPSYSLQPIMESASGYKNVIKNATITATNSVAGNGTAFLKDGIYKNHNFNFIKEFKSKGGTEIVITLDKVYDVSAIMIYNAFDFLEAFAKIDRIEFKTENADYNGIAYIENLGFDKDKHVVYDSYYPFESYMRPGGSAIAHFNPLKTKEIKIILSAGSKMFSDAVIDDEPNELADIITISDIVILGK